MMGRIVLEIPDELQARWEQIAKASGQSLEEFIVQEISKRFPPLLPEIEDPREFAKAILREAGLLEEFTEEEKTTVSTALYGRKTKISREGWTRETGKRDHLGGAR